MGERPEADAGAAGDGMEATAASEGNAWGTGEELLLASAVERFGCNNWNRVATELRLRPSLLILPLAHFTPEACKLKFCEMEKKFSSNSSVEKKHGECLPWIEDLRQRRIEYLKHKIAVHEISINLRQEKLKKLKAERDKELLDKNDTAFAPAIQSRALGAEPRPVVTGTALPLSFANQDMMVQDSDAQNSCDDNDTVKKHMMANLPTSCSLPGRGCTSFSIAETGIVNLQALRCLELEETKSLDPDPASAARTKGKHPEKVKESLSKSEQHVVEEELVVQQNALLVDKPDSGQHCLSNEAVIKSQKQMESAATEKGVDETRIIERSDMALLSPATVSVPDSCTVLRAGKKETLLMHKHAPTKVLDDSQVQVRGVKTLLTEQSSRELGKSRCTVLDKKTPGEYLQEADTKHGDSVPLVSQGTSFAVEPGPRVDGEMDISFVSAPHSKMVSVPKMDKLSDLDNANVRIEKSSLEAIQQKLPAENSSGLVISSEGIDDASLVVCPLRKYLSVQHPGEKEPCAVLVDPPPSLLEESVILPKQQTLVVNAKVHSSDTPELNVGSSHEVESASPNGLQTRLISINENYSASLGNLRNVELQRDEVAPGDDVLELPDISNPAVLGNSTRQQTELHRDDVWGNARPLETTAQSMEASKLENPMEKLRELNSAFQVTRECSDESDQAFANNLAKGLYGTQSRSKMDLGRTEHENNAEIGRQVDDTTISPTSIDQSLAALGSKASSMSHEGIGSAQDDSKDAEGQAGIRDYGDSQADKSEVGSPADGVDDTSLTSKRSKREPRVPGKLQPLLECLRLMCAHKFAPLFKQKQESQDNQQYDLLIRRHMDLGMIRARLEEGAYSRSLEFFRDLLLIFQNALVYFPKDSQEYGAAKVLRKYAIDEMDRIFKTEASLKQDRPATRKRDSRRSSELAKQGRTSGTVVTENRKRDKARPAVSEFAYGEPVLESEGKSKSLSLSMGGPSSRTDDVDIFQSGDQEVDTHLGETMVKSSKLASQNFRREESQTLQELRYQFKGPIKEEPRDFEKESSKRPAKGIEYTASSGDAPEIEKKAVKARSNLKGTRSKDFTSKTSKLSMIQQAIKSEDITFQQPIRASRTIKQGNLRPKEENPQRKRARK